MQLGFRFSRLCAGSFLVDRALRLEIEFLLQPLELLNGVLETAGLFVAESIKQRG